MGIGNGTFPTQDTYDTGIDPSDLAIVDLDDDGAPDIVTANRHGDNVSVLFGILGGAAGAVRGEDRLRGRRQADRADRRRRRRGRPGGHRHGQQRRRHALGAAGPARPGLRDRRRHLQPRPGRRLADGNSPGRHGHDRRRRGVQASQGEHRRRQLFRGTSTAASARCRCSARPAQRLLHLVPRQTIGSDTEPSDFNAARGRLGRARLPQRRRLRRTTRPFWRPRASSSTTSTTPTSATAAAR